MEDSDDKEFDDLIRLSFFAGMAKAIVSARTLKDTFRAIMDEIGEIFAPQNWSLLLRDPRSGKLRFELAIGTAAENLRGTEIAADQGVAGWIARNALPVIIADASSDPRFDGSVDARTGFKTLSIIGVPLISHGTVFGVIELINREDGGPFTPYQLKILTTIADFAAIAIEKHYYLLALRRVASVDPLTGLFNRRSFNRAIERERNRCVRNGKSFSLLILDVDKFKDINDRYGHAAGDAVLRRLAAVLKAAVRKVDIACRIGGDEFAVILPDTERRGADEVEGRIRDLLAASGADEIPFGVSIGISENDGRSSLDPLTEADDAMYRDKARRFEETAEDLKMNLKDLYESEGGEV